MFSTGTDFHTLKLTQNTTKMPVDKCAALAAYLSDHKKAFDDDYVEEVFQGKTDICAKQLLIFMDFLMDTHVEEKCPAFTEMSTLIKDNFQLMVLVMSVLHGWAMMDRPSPKRNRVFAYQCPILQKDFLNTTTLSTQSRVNNMFAFLDKHSSVRSGVQRATLLCQMLLSHSSVLFQQRMTAVLNLHADHITSDSYLFIHKEIRESSTFSRSTWTQQAATKSCLWMLSSMHKVLLASVHSGQGNSGLCTCSFGGMLFVHLQHILLLGHSVHRGEACKSGHEHAIHMLSAQEKAPCGGLMHFAEKVLECSYPPKCSTNSQGKR